MEFLDGYGKPITLGDTVAFMSKGVARMGTVFYLGTKLMRKHYNPKKEKYDPKAMKVVHTIKLKVRETYYDRTMVYHNPSKMWVQDQHETSATD